MLKKTTPRQILLILCLLPLLAAAGWCELRINRLSLHRAEIKRNYSEVNSIEYGLLSVDAWRDNVEKILTDRIEDFTLSPEQERVLRTQISQVLNGMITQADSMVQHNNRTVKGKLTKAAVNTFVDWKDIRARVPSFSQTIINDIKKPGNKKQLQGILVSKINEYAAETYDSSAIDSANLRKVMAKYATNSINNFNLETARRIDILQEKTYWFSFVVLAIMFLFLGLWLALFRIKELRTPLFILSVILALSVLLVGLTSPMIEIDARVKKLDFELLGEHLIFKDQILFYQSKSIIDVVRILLATNRVDSIFVGILILTFSVLFPITKLISTEVYLLGNEKVRKNKVIYFFAFKSGKWSMADVTVVAIFMAYVGFRGILDNQLQNVDINRDSLHSIATNLTSLQPGFILFVAFVLFGLVLSEILKRISGGAPGLGPKSNEEE